MLTLHCPNCGVHADETDLHAEGEAHLKRFGPGSSDDDFDDYMFQRQNPKGVHFERWRHVYGCGKWFPSGPLHRNPRGFWHVLGSNARATTGDQRRH